MPRGQREVRGAVEWLDEVQLGEGGLQVAGDGVRPVGCVDVVVERGDGGQDGADQEDLPGQGLTGGGAGLVGEVGGGGQVVGGSGDPVVRR